MSSFNSQQPAQQSSNPQPTYQQQYTQPNPNQPFSNMRGQPNPNYQYPPQQYPPYQQQYPPQQQYQSHQQQQGYPVQNPYQNFAQRNAPQYNPQIDQQYAQTQLPNPNIQNPGLVPTPQIPQNSPLLRHSLTEVVASVKKNLQEFSPEFQQKFADNESFKSLNRKIVFIPSFLMMAHVLLNRNKKWFRLTVNARLIRYSLVGLLLMHFSTNVLYVAAYRDLIARNRQKIEKIIVREEFIGGTENRVV